MSKELIGELNAETDQSIEKLYDLINITRDIMLRKPGQPLSPPKNKKPLESGWKLAKEFQDADDYFGGSAEQVVEGLEPDRQVIEAIEALGNDILEEAFDCLGEEAQEVLEVFNDLTEENTQKLYSTWLGSDAAAKAAKEFTNLPDETSRMILVDWLQTRIKQIKKVAEHQFQDEDYKDYHYSATRLSPKLIGKYPDINLRPTCLSGSILALSFFHKTDLPMLHGNVSHSATQEFVRAQNSSIDQLLFADYENRIELSDQMKQRLLEVKTAIMKSLDITDFMPLATLSLMIIYGYS